MGTMSKKLTDLQLRILRALREHKEKNTSKIFSMDDFYENLPAGIEKNHFQESQDRSEQSSLTIMIG